MRTVSHSPAPPAVRAYERELFERVQHHGDLAARTELVERFLPLARKLARRYERASEPMEDLVQVASLGLLKAIDRFECERGDAFSSYAVPTILGELKRHFRDAGWAVHVPRSLQERVLDVNAAVERLSRDLGRSPSPQQVAIKLDLPAEKVLEALEAGAAYDAISLDGPRRSSEEESDTVADGLGQADGRFELIEDRATIGRGFKSLPQRERRILYLRFAEELTQAEIGARMEMSQMHVSRLIRRSIARLRVVATAE
jgi:RNA polymerase sigma-B factor